jgi:hypothetical protein
VTDQELDRLLAAAMQVEHSPEFLPRVRQRVERDAGSWWRVARWPLALVGTGAMVTAIAAAVLVWPRQDSPAAVPRRVVAAPVAAAPVVSPTARPAAALASAATRRIRQVQDVVIAPEEFQAMRLVIERARKGGIPEVLPTDRHVVVDDRSLRRLEIPAVRIEPLAGSEQWQEGDHPW